MRFKDLLIDILAMYDEGLDVVEIARALQCGRSVVEYVIDTYGTAMQD